MSLRDEVEAGLAEARKVQSCEDKLKSRDERIRALEAGLRDAAQLQDKLMDGISSVELVKAIMKVSTAAKSLLGQDGK